MPYAAISYDIKPGFEDEIAEVLANFRRPDSPVVLDDAGEQIGRLLGTAVFVRGELMIRVIHYEGCELADVSRYMARQPGVYEVLRNLGPYLAAPRDASGEAGFRASFGQNTVRCLSQFSVEQAAGSAVEPAVGSAGGTAAETALEPARVGAA